MIVSASSTKGLVATEKWDPLSEFLVLLINEFKNRLRRKLRTFLLPFKRKAAGLASRKIPAAAEDREDIESQAFELGTKSASNHMANKEPHGKVGRGSFRGRMRTLEYRGKYAQVLTF